MSRLAFANPSGLWALAAVAVVAVLYLLYRRYRPQPVTGLFLWGTAPRHNDGGRRLDSPLKNRAFWCDLLAATLFALALAGPVITGGRQAVVVILDNSFAMRSRDNHHAAAETARRLLEDADRSAVVLAGTLPRILVDFDRSPGRAAAAITDHYRADEPAGDLAAALTLARDAWGDDPVVHVITNQDAAATSSSSAGRVTRHILSGRGDNLALTDAWRRPSRTEPGRDRVVAMVRNWSRGERLVRVTLQAGYGTAPTGDELLIEELRLPAGAGRFVDFTVPQSPEILWLTVGGPGDDVIPDDSRLALPPPDRRRPTYRLDSAGTGLARFVEPALRAAGAVPAFADAKSADILVVSGWQPESTMRGIAATLAFVAPIHPGIPAPPYFVEGEHQITTDVDLGRVVWTAASGTVENYPIARELVSAGPLPLVWLDDAGRAVVNASLEQNYLFRHATWPVLIGNIVTQAADNLPGIRNRLVHPGDPLRIVPPSGRTASPRLYRDGTPVPATRTGDTLIAPREPGVYSVRDDINDTPISADDSAGIDGDIDGVAVSVVPNFDTAGDTTGLSNREGVAAAAAESRDADSSADGTRLDWLALVLGAIPLFLNWRRRREG